MSEPDWAIVLEEFHDQAPRPLEKRVHENHALVQNTDLEMQELQDSIQSLQDWGLLEEREAEKMVEVGPKMMEVPEENTSRTEGYQLTTKGFEVAHDREQSKQSQKINQLVAAFTLVLVVVEIINSTPISPTERLGPLSLVLVSLFYIGYKTGGFDF